MTPTLLCHYLNKLFNNYVCMILCKCNSLIQMWYYVPLWHGSSFLVYFRHRIKYLREVISLEHYKVTFSLNKMSFPRFLFYLKYESIMCAWYCALCLLSHRPGSIKQKWYSNFGLIKSVYEWVCRNKILVFWPPNFKWIIEW